MNSNYEYCVMHRLFPDDPHRDGLTEQECLDWVREFEADGGKSGSFYVAVREVGPWQKR